VNTRRAGNIIVVGAGIAGLAAARELVDKNFDVTILESRARAGGRIWTDHSLDVPIDLGAAWIHGKSKNPIYELSLRNQIKTAPCGFSNSVLIDDRGKQVSLIQKLKFASRADRILPRLKRLAKQLDRDISVGEGIRKILEETKMIDQEVCFLNRHLIEFEAMNGASIDEQSLFALTEGSIGFSGGDLIFPNGYAEILESLASGVRIKYKEIVESVEYNEGGVTVVTNRGTHQADAAVITLPLGVLKAGRVKFSPALPASMQASISELKMGLFNKVAMRFSEIFWPKDCDMIEIVPAKKRPVCQFINWYKYSKEPILIGCVAADTAKDWETESDEEITWAMSALLERLFGKAATKPIASTITRWGQDEFALGSYSVVHPGATAQQFDALAEPVGRLFFAGEATSRLHQGTVPGAYISGVRAAKQIAERAFTKAKTNYLN